MRHFDHKAVVLIPFLVISIIDSYAFGDLVTPSDRVVNYVNIREGSSTSSESIGKLKPGEKVEFISVVGKWYKIKTASEDIGFVSRNWTVRVEAGALQPAFKIHFLDVGTGDSIIIDIGDKEVIIDGGMYASVLDPYLEKRHIIDGPIELVVVTHGDSDHWKGINHLLGFDGSTSNPPAVLEFWEPGYDRDCNELESFNNFIGDVQSLPGIIFNRPLENSHPPSVITGVDQPFSLSSIPELQFTVLHTDATPEASNNDCPYRINNASIVLMVEISGFKFLFSGDANGKERDEEGDVAPGHIEKKLLDFEQTHPGSLKADVLKVPHHGSESASTRQFIDAVNPRFAIISASTTHHLPKDTVVNRYEAPDRVILRTDATPPKDKDHIICYRTAVGDLDCNYEIVLIE